METRSPLPAASLGEPEFWQAALDSLTAHVAVLDERGEILVVNAAWSRVGGQDNARDLGALVGQNYVEACERLLGVDREEGPAVAAGIREVSSGVRQEFSLAYSCRNAKRKRWFMLRLTRFVGAGPTRVVAAHENITASKAAELRARRQADELRRAQVLESHCSRVLERIAANDLLETVFTELAALVQEQEPGLGVAWAAQRDGQGCLLAATQDWQSDWNEALLGALPDSLGTEPAATHSLQHLQNALSGSPSPPAPGQLEFRPLRLGKEPTLGIMGTWRKPGWRVAKSVVLERAAALAVLALDHCQLSERLAFQAQHDSLTELPNRLLFQERLQQVLARARRHGTCFAVMMVDLDRFKQINDLYGHRAGDSLLRQVARRLQACLREVDTVARLGGDEFIIVLDEIQGSEAAEVVARKITAAMQTPFQVGPQNLAVTGSVGVSLFPSDGDDAAALVRNADTAMYEAKSCGRNAYQLFTREMGASARERLEIENHLRDALQAGEFTLEYQPQFDLRRKLVGMEALLRWNNRTLGLVSPSLFIPIAEDSGLIIPIGTWALREACRQNVAWQSAGCPPLRMAVNVSALQLARHDFADTVSAVLSETGLNPELLELEVTETSMMQNIDESVREMERLRQLGVRISIDDFGTGYCSLSYLQNLPVDTVKIDRSFVQKLDGGSRNTASVLRAIVGLAHHLNLKVVAEGVETEEQMEALGGLSCDLAQGYLLHRPATPGSLERMMQDSAAEVPAWLPVQPIDCSPSYTGSSAAGGK